MEEKAEPSKTEEKSESESEPEGGISIEKVQQSNKDMIEDCPICFVQFNKRHDDVAFLGCTHWFHRKCIYRWLKKKKECPICLHPTEKVFRTR